MKKLSEMGVVLLPVEPILQPGALTEAREAGMLRQHIMIAWGIVQLVCAGVFTNQAAWPCRWQLVFFGVPD